MIPTLVRVAVSPSPRGWLVDAVLQFDTSRYHGDSARDFQLDFSNSPLGWAGEYERSHPSSDIEPSQSWAANSDVTSVPCNGGESVVLRLEWLPGLANASPGTQREAWGKTPCLVLPDMLPSIHSGLTVIGSIAPPLPRIVFDEPLPDHLSSGGVLEASGSDRFLQVVVFDSRRHTDPFNDIAIALDPNSAQEANVDAAYEYLRPLTQFVRSELDVNTVARPVAFLTESASDYTCAGAFFAARAADVGGVKSSTGKPVQAIRLIAQSWFAAGTRISGHEATVLELSLGGALGLTWLAEANHRDARKQLLDQMRINVAEASNTAVWSTALRVQELEVALAEGFERAPVRRLISEIVTDHWGLFLPQERLVDALRRAGVRLPQLSES